MWRQLFLCFCALVPAAAKDVNETIWGCGYVNNCMLCAASLSWTGVGAHCRWCPDAKACFEYGSVYNPCASDVVVTDPNACPAESEEPAEFVEAEAKDMAIYSSIAYCPPSNIESWRFPTGQCSSKTEGFQLDHTFQGVIHSGNRDVGGVGSPKGFSYAFVGHIDSRKQIVVSFKGSNSSQEIWDIDLMTDLNRSLSYSWPCQLLDAEKTVVTTHKGFCEYYRSLNDGSSSDGSLAVAIDSLHAKYPDYQVFFTGHSLGAAVAELQAVTFGLRTGVKPRMLTFGQPRAGDHSLAVHSETQLARGSARVTHGRDLVPHVPLCCSGGPPGTACLRDAGCPVHGVREVWYPDSMAEGGNHRFCNGTDAEDNSCSDGLFSTVSTDDHRYYFGWDIGTLCCYPASAGQAALASEEMLVV